MLSLRYADPDDVELYFKWVNDDAVRQNSIHTNEIVWKDHVTWFNKKLVNDKVFMYVFLDKSDIPVGQVIIEIKEQWTSIGQSVAKEHRGKKYSTEMLSRSTDDFLSKYPRKTIVSVIRSSNIASLRMSKKSGFNILAPDQESDICLVLKGHQQNDNQYILKSKRLFTS